MPCRPREELCFLCPLPSVLVELSEVRWWGAILLDVWHYMPKGALGKSFRFPACYVTGMDSVSLSTRKNRKTRGLLCSTSFGP